MQQWLPPSGLQRNDRLEPQKLVATLRRWRALHRNDANIKKNRPTPATMATPRQISIIVSNFMGDDPPWPPLQLPATATGFEYAALAIRHTIGADLARRKLVRLTTHGAAGAALGCAHMA